MADSDIFFQKSQAAGDRGVPSLVTRNDSVADLAGADGQYTTLQVNASGQLYVTGGGGGTEYTEDEATANPIVGTATMMERDDALGGLTPAEGDWAALRCDANGALWVAVNNTVTVTESSPISGFATTAKQLADGHNVTVDNAAAGAAVNIQDGGNTITVDGAVTVSATNLDCQSGGADMATAAGQLADSHNVTEDSPALVGPAAITVDSYTQVAINLTTGADQVLVSSAANKQIWVYGYTIVCGDADGQTISFQDEDNAALSGVMEFAQYGGASVSPSGNFAMPLWKLGTDKDLEIDITGGDADGHLTYAILSV